MGKIGKLISMALMLFVIFGAFNGCQRRADENVVEGILKLQFAVVEMSKRNSELCVEKINALYKQLDAAETEEEKIKIAGQIHQMKELLEANMQLPGVIEELRKWAMGDGN